MLKRQYYGGSLENEFNKFSFGDLAPEAKRMLTDFAVQMLHGSRCRKLNPAWYSQDHLGDWFQGRLQACLFAVLSGNSYIRPGTDQSKAFLQVLLILTICGVKLPAHLDALLADIKSAPSVNRFLVKFPPHIAWDKAFSNSVVKVTKLNFNVENPQAMQNRAVLFFSAVHFYLSKLLNDPPGAEEMEFALFEDATPSLPFHLFSYICAVMWTAIFPFVEVAFDFRRDLLAFFVRSDITFGLRVIEWNVIDLAEINGYPDFLPNKMRYFAGLIRTDHLQLLSLIPNPIGHFVVVYLAMCVTEAMLH